MEGGSGRCGKKGFNVGQLLEVYLLGMRKEQNL